MKCDTCGHIDKEASTCDLGYELNWQERHTPTGVQRKNYRPVRTPEPERKDLMNQAYCSNHTELNG